MTIKIVIQNRETKHFFQSGTAWTMNGERAFDFQSIEAAQLFWRENQLVCVRIAFMAVKRSTAFGSLRPSCSPAATELCVDVFAGMDSPQQHMNGMGPAL